MSYFGIAIYNPKHSVNIGSLARSAHSFGAAFIAVIGARFTKQHSDTGKSWVNIPIFQFKNWEDFKNNPIYNCQKIAIELNEKAVPLKGFRHPDRAVYILGAEDHGLPDSVLDDCQKIVYIPGGAYCLNVSVAGSIVIYDRMSK